MKIPAAALAAAALLGGCSETGVESASKAGGDCFHADSVTGFTPRGEEAVDIQVGASRHYRLELASHCPGVDWSHQIAIRTRGGSSFICRGMDAEIIAPNPGLGPQRCWVSQVRRLGEAEVEASRQAR